MTVAEGRIAASAKAATLIEALPWLNRFHGQTVVIKYGGHAMAEDELRLAFAQDLVFLRYAGLRPVVVHGGGPQISAQLDRLGVATSFTAGLRVTTPETMDVVRMVLTDVAGLYRDWPSSADVISQLTAAELERLLPGLSAGMIPKMEACLTAVRGGVPQAHVLDGRLSHAVLLEIFTDSGIGTMVLPGGEG